MMCVCDKIDWMENGWMDWIEWMWMWKVESGCGWWKVDSGAVPDLTHAYRIVSYITDNTVEVECG